jgi:hypothetical protein
VTSVVWSVASPLSMCVVSPTFGPGAIAVFLPWHLNYRDYAPFDGNGNISPFVRYACRLRAACRDPIERNARVRSGFAEDEVPENTSTNKMTLFPIGRHRCPALLYPYPVNAGGRHG